MSDADPSVSAIPQDPLICNGAALRKATRRVSQLYDTVLAPCGLKVSQHSILVHIARAGTPSMTDLARAMVLDLSLIHISEPTRQAEISYAVFCLKKKSIPSTA